MPRDDDAAAILAARSDIVTALMTAMMRRQARRRFHAVRLALGSRPAVDPAAGLIVYSNHPSWWDPAMFVLLQSHVFPGRRGYGPMEEEALTRYAVLRRIGVFGLNPDSRRGAARFLQVGRLVLQTPDTSLWVTAEGAFTDPRRRPLRLRHGVAHLLHGQDNVVALPLAMEYPFWNESAPEALLRFGPPVAADPGRSVADWQTTLTQALEATMDRLAEDALARDPARFETLVSGRVGIGGIYDLWRRRSLLRGQRPHLAHEEPGR
ncbi:MAG: lysophospholipid acyltransferase family protein [Proteobacteria bacterium]|nr:lysophospholipid acyltransferase family protein [Pseudomonadota bacterium]